MRVFMDAKYESEVTFSSYWTALLEFANGTFGFKFVIKDEFFNYKKCKQM